MVRACVLDFGGSRGDHLSLVEFAYNNSYDSSIRMLVYKALYGRPCKSTLCWVETGDQALLGLKVIDQMTEKIHMIKAQMKPI